MKLSHKTANPTFEKLAEIEHERWADWQAYVHSKMFKDGEYMCLSVPNFERWERQIKTPYAELSEEEKDSDRDQVVRYWDLIFPRVDIAHEKELRKNFYKDVVQQLIHDPLMWEVIIEKVTGNSVNNDCVTAATTIK